MSVKLYSAVLICILVFGGAVSSFATEEVGTIVLKSGKTFENVTFKVNKQYKVITMTEDGEEKNILFSDILFIHDADGLDISTSILGIREKPKEVSPWQSQGSVIHRKARERKWNVAFSFKLGYNTPTGDFYDGVTGGIGFGGDFRIAVSNQIALIATVSRTGLDFDNSIFLTSPDPSVTILAQDFSMSATRILFGAEYYRPLGQDGGPGMWYINTLLGVITHDLTTSLTVRDNFTNQVVTVGGDTTLTQFAATIGGGIVPMISSKIGIDLSGDLDLVYVSVDNGNTSTASVEGIVFNLHAGLIFFL